MRIGMSNKAVTTAPACFRDHPNLAGTTCEQCGMAIPGGKLYSPDERVHYSREAPPGERRS